MEDVEMAGEMVEDVVVTGEVAANRLTRSTRNLTVADSNFLRQINICLLNPAHCAN